MKIRFLADEDFSRKIIFGLLEKQPRIDFVRAIDVGLRGKHDADVLRAAAEMGRLLVTHDQRTMPTEFGRFLQQSQSPGLLIVPQSLPMRAVIDELQLIWELSEAEEWIGRISVVPL